MDKLRDLKQELTDWVTAYKDAAERNALAENPDESAEYLISLIEPRIEEAKRQGGKKALRRILRESKYLSPYELMSSIKQALGGK